MLRLPGKGIEYGEIWFDEEPEQPMPDILICRQRAHPWPGSTSTGFSTLVIDLSESEDALFASVKKEAQYKIRRAGREGARFAFLDDPGHALDEFCAFHDRFVEASSGVGAVSRPWMREAASQGQLALTYAAMEGEPLVWHSYLVARDRARLLHSASLFRLEDSAGRSRIGRLNRWLHWQDILEFRRRGVRTYDLGGVFDDDAAAASGINRFKEEFGGSLRRDYNCVVAISARGRAYLALQRLWGLVRRRREP